MGLGILARLTPALAACVMLAFLGLLATAFGSRLVQHSMTEMLILLVVVIGMYCFIGLSGILSFGHISFMAWGAYCAAWLTLPLPLKRLNMPGLPDLLHEHSIPPFWGVLAASATAAFLAALIGFPLLRLAGIAASIATLAVLMITAVTFSNWESVTLGTSSIVGLPPYGGVWTAFGWAAAALILVRLFETSRQGMMVRSARENEVAAKSIGVNVFAVRLLAWVLSAAIVAAGGALYAHFIGSISVDAFHLNMTFITIAMLIVGGSGSLAGALAGVAGIGILIEVLRQFERGVTVGGQEFLLPPGSQELGIAGAMLVTLLLRPKGLISAFDVRAVSPRWTLFQAKTAGNNS